MDPKEVLKDVLNEEQVARLKAFDEKLAEYLFEQFPEMGNPGEVGGAILGGVLGAVTNNIGGLLANVYANCGKEYHSLMRKKVFERIDNATYGTLAMVAAIREGANATKN